MFLPSADASFGQCLQELMNIQCPTWISRKRLAKAPGEWAWTFTCVKGAFNKGQNGRQMTRCKRATKRAPRRLKIERVKEEFEELKMRGP